MDLPGKKQLLVKLLRLCHSTQTEEAARAAARVRQLVVELRPNAWRWGVGLRTLTLPVTDFLNKNGDQTVEGKTAQVLIVTADQVRVWRNLPKGWIGVVVQNWLVFLPADSAEPVW